jgi:hypothetical protein
MLATAHVGDETVLLHDFLDTTQRGIDVFAGSNADLAHVTRNCVASR